MVYFRIVILLVETPLKMSTEPVKILSASVQKVLQLIEIKAKQQNNNIESCKLS